VGRAGGDWEEAERASRRRRAVVRQRRKLGEVTGMEGRVKRDGDIFSSVFSAWSGEICVRGTDAYPWILVEFSAAV
jgi:hypothetical protein